MSGKHKGHRPRKPPQLKVSQEVNRPGFPGGSIT